MKDLTFGEIVRELRNRGYIGDRTPKKIVIEAEMPTKFDGRVIVKPYYNCDMDITECGNFFQSEQKRRE